jgi:hypothetical protein
MRLTENRIQFIAQQILKELLDSKEISFTGSKMVLESEIARIIFDDLRIEDEIDQEVVEMISKMKRNIPPGSAEWDAIFQEKKAEIARRRNYIY